MAGQRVLSHGSPQKTPFTPTCPGMFCCTSCSNHHCLSNHITVYCSKMNLSAGHYLPPPQKQHPLPNCRIYSALPRGSNPFLSGTNSGQRPVLCACALGVGASSRKRMTRISPRWTDVSPRPSGFPWKKRGIRFVGLVEVKGRSPSPKRKVKGRNPLGNGCLRERNFKGRTGSLAVKPGFRAMCLLGTSKTGDRFGGGCLRIPVVSNRVRTKNSSVRHIWLVISWYFKRTKRKQQSAKCEHSS